MSQVVEGRQHQLRQHCPYQRRSQAQEQSFGPELLGQLTPVGLPKVEVNRAIPTLPQLLQDVGYTTACFGTWQISAEFWDRGIEEGNQLDTGNLLFYY